MDNEPHPEHADGEVGAGVCPVPDMPQGVQEGRGAEAYVPYGNLGRDILASIRAIPRFAQGYPKRIIVGLGQPHASLWQAYYDWTYQEALKRHAELTGKTPLL